MYGQYKTACYLLNGLGTQKNETEAIEWLKKAATQELRNAIDKLRELGIAWEGKYYCTLIEQPKEICR